MSDLRSGPDTVGSGTTTSSIVARGGIVGADGVVSDGVVSAVSLTRSAPLPPVRLSLARPPSKWSCLAWRWRVAYEPRRRSGKGLRGRSPLRTTGLVGFRRAASRNPARSYIALAPKNIASGSFRCSASTG